MYQVITVFVLDIVLIVEKGVSGGRDADTAWKMSAASQTGEVCC